MDSQDAQLYKPPGLSKPVRTEEVVVVMIVLLVWALVVYIFFHQWGNTECKFVFIIQIIFRNLKNSKL